MLDIDVVVDSLEAGVVAVVATLRSFRERVCEKEWVYVYLVLPSAPYCSSLMFVS